jgi:hypothetical protein
VVIFVVLFGNVVDFFILRQYKRRAASGATASHQVAKKVELNLHDSNILLIFVLTKRKEL